VKASHINSLYNDQALLWLLLAADPSRLQLPFVSEDQ
jgi:hypothetical protein